MRKISLKVSGKSYPSWTSVRVRRSMGELVHSFSFETTQESAMNAFEFKIGDKCEVLLEGGDEPFITGYIDRIERSFDKDNHSISVSGRSKTEDLVDSHQTKAFEGLSLGAICVALSKPFGIVVNEKTKTKTIEKFSLSAETPLSAIGPLAKAQNILLLCDGFGALNLEKVSNVVLQAGLEEGINVLSARLSQDASSVFSSYEIKGKKGQTFGIAKNTDIISRFRPFEAVSDKSQSNEACEKRALFERNRKNEESFSIGVVIQGFEYAKGLFFKENRLIKTTLPTLGIDETLLIRSVEFSLDLQQGSLTSLELTKRESYE